MWCVLYLFLFSLIALPLFAPPHRAALGPDLGRPWMLAADWYILHQTVIVAVGSAVVSWDLPVAPKYLAVLIVSTALTFALYEILVRRRDASRFLFGLKPRARVVALATAAR